MKDQRHLSEEEIRISESPIPSPSHLAWLALQNVRSASAQLLLGWTVLTIVLLSYFLGDRNGSLLLVGGLRAEEVRVLVWVVLVGCTCYVMALLPLYQKSRQELREARTIVEELVRDQTA